MGRNQTTRLNQRIADSNRAIGVRWVNQKESRQLSSELFAYTATFSMNHRCFPKRKSAQGSDIRTLLAMFFSSANRRDEKDTEENDLLPESKGQRLQSSRLMERRCLTVFLPNRLQV